MGDIAFCDARLVHPERTVLAICGDGGFMMNFQDLDTAACLHQDSIILVLIHCPIGYSVNSEKDSDLVEMARRQLIIEGSD